MPTPVPCIKEFTSRRRSADSGLAHVAAFGESPPARCSYVYGGDLLGNVWRFDLRARATPTPKCGHADRAPPAQAQPVTAAPELL